MVPAPSAFSLAAARLCWALPETALVSLHGRELYRIRPHLHPGARILALTSDSEGPAALARLLTELGFGASRLTVLEALGGGNERVRSTTAETSHLRRWPRSTSSPSKSRLAPDAQVIAFSAGLDDDLFEHDGQITKREIRAVTLSSLAPRAGELLWDIGAGSGSVAIEWMLRIRRCAPSRSRRAPTAPRASAAMLQRSACRGSMSSKVTRRRRCPDSPTPDAIFVGGGASETGVLDAAIAALRPGGRLVANAVTLETEAELIARHSGARRRADAHRRLARQRRSAARRAGARRCR